MKKCTYAAHVEKNGKRVITVNKIHDNLSAAKHDAAALAAMIPGAKGVVVKRNTSQTTRRNPANPPREVVLGHVVVHTKAGYTIPAYKKVFAEMKEVRNWLKAHVAREREAKTNPPKCRCK